MPTQPYRVGFLNIVPPGCTPERTVQDDDWFAAEDARYRAAEAAGTQERFRRAENPCMTGGASYTGSGQILLLPADEVVRRLGLDARRRADAVRAGAVVARELPGELRPAARRSPSPGAGSLVDPTATGADRPRHTGGRARQPAGRRDAAHSGDRGPDAQRQPRARRRHQRDQGLAHAHREPHRPGPHGSRGSPTRRREAAAGAEGDEATRSTSSGGFSRDDAIIVAVLLGVFALLILVITLTSTALTLAEQQTDQATLAALGATRGTRRLDGRGRGPSSSRPSAACSGSPWG